MAKTNLNIEFFGGATEELFRGFNGINLEYISDTHDYLKLVHKKFEAYHSLIDFIFCELYPKYKRLCLASYEGHQNDLMVLIPEEQIPNIRETVRHCIILTSVYYVEHRDFPAIKLLPWKMIVQQSSKLF